MSESYIIWVCQNCMLHHANGECGDCHNPDGHEGGEPLSLLSNQVAMGMAFDEHAEDCEYRTDRLSECDCEEITFSTRTCQGCGSEYHGERHAMTEWED